ncbi:MAG: sigma-70 family RNA polymerase sigma factor [Acidobacteria bacterium]|nr:sigma-70 family RNA polymerase sigma factor [Acidobacteriota bacterium]
METHYDTDLSGLAGLSGAEAVPALVERLGDKVFAFSLKFCGNREDAEDLVQETFLQAFRGWDRFEGRSSPSSWLYTIAAHACQRMRRKKAGEPPHVDSLDAELPDGPALVARLPGTGDGPLEEELRKEAAEIVDRSLARLPVEFRLPLVLKEIGELPLKEISEIVGVKEATVKTRVHRGRLALRGELVRALGREEPAASVHPNQVCRDLLQAKLESMDRGVDLDIPAELLCDRCRAFLESLDFAAEACRWVQGGELPEKVRRSLVQELRPGPN